MTSTVAIAKTMAERWGIVGGGLLGLSLARGLARRGCAVTLLERERAVGGLARPWRLGELDWDRYYHVILPGDGRVLALLDELGLTPELCWRTTRTGFYTDGALHSVSSAPELLRFPPLGLTDILRLGATVLYASRLRDWRSLERETAVDWLTRWSGRRTVEKLWRPLLRAKLGTHHEQASAAFIWATIRRLYSARRTGMKREQLGFVRGGYGRILDRLAASLRDAGVKLHTDAAVSQVRSGEGAGGRVRVTTDQGEQTFDQVALTVATPLAAALCDDLPHEERARLQGLDYLGIVCAAVLLRTPPPEYYVTNIADPEIPFTAVINMSALVGRDAFGEDSLVYLPKYVAAEDPLLRQPDEELQSLFTAALLRMVPRLRAEDVLRVQLARDRYVMAAPRVNLSRLLPPKTSAVPGVHFVSNAHVVGGNLNVDEILGLADAEADRLGRRS